MDETLDVDVCDWVDPLFHRADEEEREREPEQEPDDSSKRWVDESKSAIRDLDMMFEGLIREILERTPK